MNDPMRRKRCFNGRLVDSQLGNVDIVLALVLRVRECEKSYAVGNQ
jgi:hypothetical protein